jgi:predicted O-methyltransferase YrrM
MSPYEEAVQRVEERCRSNSIYMLGPEKARFLRDLIIRAKPLLVVECGTAIGYSGLHIADGLRANGRGRLLTIEIDHERAGEAEENIRSAGLLGFVEIKRGDAVQVLQTLQDPVDFLFLDNSYRNYFPCFQAIRHRLTKGAWLVADNVGIGEREMADYLSHVRSCCESATWWFDTDLPWALRDAMEVTRYRVEKTRRKDASKRRV